MDIKQMSTHTPGPWDWHGPYMTICYKVSALTPAGRQTVKVFVDHCEDRNTEADARLIAAAPALLAEAQLMRCLASSPRFQEMTVSGALAELANNGMPHDNGAAIAKAVQS